MPRKDMRRFLVSLTEAELTELETAAGEENRSRANLVRHILLAWLADRRAHRELDANGRRRNSDARPHNPRPD